MTSVGIAALADALENTDIPLPASLERAFSVRVFYEATMPEAEGESASSAYKPIPLTSCVSK